LDSLGVAQRLKQVFTDKYNESIKANLGPELALQEAQKARSAELVAINKEAANAIKVQDMQTAGELASVAAFGESNTAGIRAISVEQARVKAITEGGDAQRIANSELQKNATAAVLASRQQAVAQEPVLARQE